jgi:hypothetical protein
MSIIVAAFFMNFFLPLINIGWNCYPMISFKCFEKIKITKSGWRESIDTVLWDV